MLTLVCVGVLLAGGQKEARPTPPTPAELTGPWSLEAAAAPYRGQKINIVSPTWRSALEEVAKDFTARTGIQVEVIVLPFDEHYEKSILDAKMGTGNYDLNMLQIQWSAFPENDLLADPEHFFSNKALADPDYDRDDFINVPAYAGWKGKQYAMGFYITAHALFYRADLFENPSYQRQFKARYGYDLTPPADWKQYHDAAEFFNDVVDWKSPSGERGHGTVVKGKRDPEMWYDFLNRFSGMTLAETGKRVELLDERQQPTFNNDIGVRALEAHKAVIQYAPKGVFEVAYTESRALLTSGRAAMLEQWLSLLQPANDPKASQVAGSIKVVPIPGGRSTLGGWALGILKSSKNKEAAFLFAQFLTSKENDMKLFVLGGKLPARKSNIESPEMAKVYSGDLSQITKTLSDTPSPPRIPEQLELRKIWEQEYARALLGEIGAKTALTNIERAWLPILAKYK